jgi:hypothetical protein
VARCVPVVDRTFDQPRFSAVVREQLRLGFGGFGEALLQHRCDAGVEVLPAGL